MCVCGKGGWVGRGAWGVDGGWMPLPTRPQHYCDPASLVLTGIEEKHKKIFSLWILLNFNKNKVGYTATLVVCGRAGAVFELLEHLGKCSEAKDRKNIKKSKVGTDQPTNQPTYRRTKQGVESHSTWLKMIKIRKKLPYNHLFECQMGELIRAEYDNIRFEFPKCPGRYLEQIWYPNFSNLLDFY